MTLKEFKKRIEAESVAIYGAGYVGKRFFGTLKEQGLAGKVRCFATTYGSEKECEGLPVFSIDELAKICKEDMLVCIAVHEVILPEIIHALTVHGIKDYCWIYPFLYQLMLGDPIHKRVPVLLSDIIKAEENNRQIEVRLLAIESYLEKSGNGFDIYRKAMGMHSTKSAVELRLKAFAKLIDNWNKHGCDDSKRPFLLNNHEIMDGAHRISLAIYFEMKSILCDIFSPSESWWKLQGEEAVMTVDSIRRSGLTEEEIKQIDAVHGRLLYR